MQLKRYIEPRGTATKLAKQCGLSLSTITRIAKGEIAPKLKVIRSIVEHTGGAVTAQDFMTDPAPKSAEAE